MAAALSGTYEMTMEAVCSAEKLWDAVKNSTEVMPKIYPSDIKSIEVLEGDGKSVGTVKEDPLHRRYKQVPEVSFAVEKFVSVDDDSKTIKISNIDGDRMMKCFKVYNPTLSITSDAAGSCNLKWSLEYEKANEEGLTPETIWEKTKEYLEALVAYSHQS